MITIIASLSAAILAASDSGAVPPPPLTEPAPVEQAAPAESAVALREKQVICRKVLETGSRLGGTKVCRTRLEWDQMSRMSQDVVNDRQKRSFLYGPKPG